MAMVEMACERECDFLTGKPNVYFGGWGEGFFGAGKSFI